MGEDRPECPHPAQSGGVSGQLGFQSNVRLSANELMKSKQCVWSGSILEEKMIMITQSLISVLFDQVTPFHKTGELYSSYNYCLAVREGRFS